MVVNIIDHGIGNRVHVDQSVLDNGTGTITFTGNNNEIEIGAGCILVHARFQLGSDCAVMVAPACRLAQIDLFAAKAGRVQIGARTKCTATARLYLHEPGLIQIGEDCLIAGETLFTISDMHKLIDIATGLRINPPADIIIGDRVWIAAEVTVMKGVQVGAGSAVGFRSVVTRSLPASCLAVGIPARVVREGVTWHA